MRLLFVVQRYGAEVFGGAEAFCRQLTHRLVERGHEVEVLTSAALSYVDWADHYAVGTAVDAGVKVHRLGVGRPRDNQVFSALRQRALEQRWIAPYIQREWLRQQGPWLPELDPWLRDRSGEFDATVFVTYLYYPTSTGLAAASSPTVLHPTAHDEPPAYLPVFDEMFRLPTGFGFLTEEEGDFVRRRFRVRRPSVVTGIGIDPPTPSDPADFRARFGLGDRPYIVCVGRTDPGKGSVELFNFFSAYKDRHPGPLTLVYVGEEVYQLPRRSDVVMTGFVEDAERQAGVSDSLLLVQPSFFESFSLVLVEAWAEGIPALVQGYSTVLAGQARRSGGAIPYRGYAEFEAGLDILLEDESLRRRLGAAGRAYVEHRYPWPLVLERYEAFLEHLI